MPVTTDWYLENWVMRMTYSGKLTEADILSGGEQIGVMMEMVDEPLYLLIDGRNVESFPVNFKTLLSNMEMFRERKQLARVIIVINNSLLGFFSTVAAKFFSFQLQVYQSMDEAEQILTRYLAEQPGAPATSLQSRE